MAVQDEIRVPTEEGDAVATRVAADEWLLSTPWGDQRFFGSKAEAGRELKALVATKTAGAQ